MLFNERERSTRINGQRLIFFKFEEISIEATSLELTALFKDRRKITQEK